jgi:hypothetical protein
MPHFAPPGIHHGPAEGYYEGGENNRNDILVWSGQPRPDDAAVGSGMTSASQFPIGFLGEANGVGYTILGVEVLDFQANDGRSFVLGHDSEPISLLDRSSRFKPLPLQPPKDCEHAPLD